MAKFMTLLLVKKSQFCLFFFLLNNGTISNFVRQKERKEKFEKEKSKRRKRR